VKELHHGREILNIGVEVPHDGRVEITPWVASCTAASTMALVRAAASLQW
jgi:hypothetical protein